MYNQDEHVNSFSDLKIYYSPHTFFFFTNLQQRQSPRSDFNKTNREYYLLYHIISNTTTEKSFVIYDITDLI